MSLVALASLKNSPGVTTTALALGAVWPADRQVLVAELDPAGGDVAGRFRLPGEPGLLALCAAARRHDPARRVWRFCQQLPGGLAVLTAPHAAEQVRAALVTSGLAGAFAATDADVLADCGRLDPDSLALDVVRKADFLLLITRPVYVELKRVVSGLPGLQQLCPMLGVVLIGKGNYPPGEVASVLRVEVLGSLPLDPHSATILGGASATKGALRRSPLLRYAHGLVRQLLVRLGAPAASSSRSPEITAPRPRRGPEAGR
jgi:Mrp family chromosome partitioning ATPase